MFSISLVAICHFSSNSLCSDTFTIKVKCLAELSEQTVMKWSMLCICSTV